MPLPRPSSPRRALADLGAFFRARGRHQLVAVALALLIPALILLAFYADGQTNLAPPRRSLIYAESWSASRSDAEIVAQQKIDAKIKSDYAAEKQRSYQRLEKRLGM